MIVISVGYTTGGLSRRGREGGRCCSFTCDGVELVARITSRRMVVVVIVLVFSFDGVAGRKPLAVVVIVMKDATG